MEKLKLEFRVEIADYASPMPAAVEVRLRRKSEEEYLKLKKPKVTGFVWTFEGAIEAEEADVRFMVWFRAHRGVRYAVDVHRLTSEGAKDEPSASPSAAGTEVVPDEASTSRSAPERKEASTDAPEAGSGGKTHRHHYEGEVAAEDVKDGMVTYRGGLNEVPKGTEVGLAR
ncbi:hypothetical protein L6R50_08500 [Myxococcota bacterium]|nr:hypothetical protein [Myxococcota bacterium]